MIYFVQIGSDGPIKIGKSFTPEKRIKSLQVGMPWKLRTLLISKNGDNDSQIYHRFMSSRMAGEWFYPTKELLEYIRTQTALQFPNPQSWEKARARRGTALTFVRAIIEYCDPRSLAYFHAEPLPSQDKVRQ